MQIKLGYTVKDRISGFVGVVEHLSEYAHQGSMAAVQPNKLQNQPNQYSNPERR
jgi:hypothetical protein